MPTTPKDENAKARAREAARRYRARKRGEAVPKIKTGRPRTGTLPKGWEDWLRIGNNAIYIGRESGLTYWELADPDSRVVMSLRIPEGPETWAALQRFYSTEMTTGAIVGKVQELGAICREASDWIDASADDFSVEITGGFSKMMLKVGLRSAADFFEYGRFMPQEGELYHRVDGSKRGNANATDEEETTMHKTDP